MRPATYNGARINVEIISFPQGLADSIPTAIVHPVVQLRGQIISFLSPIALGLGSYISVDSGYQGMPYSVRVDTCIAGKGGQYSVVGTFCGD